MLVEIKGKKNEEQLVTSSREVSASFEKQHYHVIRDIEGMKKDVSNFGAMFYESEYKDSYGRSQKMYLMNRDGFSLLAMGFTGTKALEWKLKYIDAFNKMEIELKRLYEERKQWEIERAKGTVIRHMLTDTIKMKVMDSPHKKFAYPNYTKLIYKVLFNKSLKELQESLGVKNKESVRDYLTADDLRDIETMETLVSSLLNCGFSYDKVKEFLYAHSIKPIE